MPLTAANIGFCNFLWDGWPDVAGRNSRLLLGVESLYMRFRYGFIFGLGRGALYLTSGGVVRGQL